MTSNKLRFPHFVSLASGHTTFRQMPARDSHNILAILGPEWMIRRRADRVGMTNRGLGFRGEVFGFQRSDNTALRLLPTHWSLSPGHWDFPTPDRSPSVGLVPVGGTTGSHQLRPRRHEADGRPVMQNFPSGWTSQQRASRTHATVQALRLI